MATRGKTHSGAKKRLHLQGNRVKRKRGNHNHILTKQTAKRKNRNAATQDANSQQQTLAYALIKNV